MSGIRVAEKDNYLIVGGGTAGHVNPAIAVVQACQTSEDANYVFLVNEGGIEQELVPQAGYSTECIKAAPLPTVHPLSWWRFCQRNLQGYLRARKLIKRYRPRAILATGGYVGSPVLLAARHLKIPFVLHEQNAYPGRSNRFFAKYAHTVCLSFIESKKYLHKKTKILLTGNPVKREFFDVKYSESRRKLNLEDDTFLILAMGGSLGANSINQGISKMVKSDEWHSFCQDKKIKLVLAAGKKNYSEVKKMFAAEQAVTVYEYIDATTWLPACDCFIGRAGASSCVELCAVGRPGLLIPYPYAANNHQYFNAKILADRGACFICQDQDLSAQRLLTFITDIYEQPELAQKMSQAAKSLANSQAAEKISGALLSI